MWHEARKQERKIRGMMVDYKKRAERRREYYEKIKADPTQFLQLHGRRCKVHLDPAVAQAADSPANMMPWQGHADTLIDRFDGRAHLDHISEYKGSTDVEGPAEDGSWEERQASYERYRILVENDFLGMSEEKFLMQIYLEEQFGPIVRLGEEEKKKSADKKAAIGYVYEDSTPVHPPPPKTEDDESKKDSDSDIDLDVTVDVNLLTAEQSKEMNEHSIKYGMVGDDFINMMTRDKEEAESLRLAKEAEEEKAMYSGRKSRRERRAFREKKLQGRKISPPSYAARESPTYDPYVRTKSPSRSRSRSPVDAGKITYITSFGGDVSDESGNERHPMSWRPGFAPSVTNVIGPSLPASKRMSESGDNLPDGPSAAAGPSLPSSSKMRVAENKRTLTSVPPSSTLAPSASVTRSRSRSRSSSNSSSSSRSRSRNRERLYRHDRNGPARRSCAQTRSHSRSPLGPRHGHKRASRRRRRTPLTHSCSSSSDSRSSSSSSNSHSRSRTRSRSRSRSSSKSRSRSHSSRGRHSSSSPRRYSREKSTSRSPNGRSPPASSISKSGSNVGASGASSSTGTVSRYYGRHRDQKDDSSSISMDDSDEDDNKESERHQTSKGRSRTNFRGQNVGGKAVYGSKTQKLTPQERLKRRMQAALNKQYKADKRAEMKKLEKQEQERQDREEELRELAIKLRRRERERRHRRQDSGGAERSPSDSRRGRSRSYSSSCSNSLSSDSDSNSMSRSRSPSAEPSAHSGSESGSDSSGKDSPRHSASGRKSRKRSRSPLVHY